MYTVTRGLFILPAVLLATVSANAETAPQTLYEIVVTAAREERPKAQTPAVIDTLSGDDIRRTMPVHPSALLNQLPGVWVNTTSGEGHMTAIRQPLTTNPVYLYLEDGVPTRSTGFFNHNALYEIDIPQAGGIEVVKGPGSVLHGSDAIGGVINVLTRTPALLGPETEASLEAGEYGFVRLLASGSGGGLRAEANYTKTDGWRDATDYDREGLRLRFDRALASGAYSKTVLAYTHIDQRTAGASALTREDYEHNPTLNYTPISFREVTALRLSSAWEHEKDDTLLSFILYARYNDMDILPNWSLSYDPTLYNTRHASLGLLAKLRRDIAPWRARLTAGADLDYSPGRRLEHRLFPTKTGKIYTDYTLGPIIYDYDVTFLAVSPYLQGELNPLERLHLVAGLRYDAMRYDYDNHLGPLDTGNWKRPPSTTLDYRHLSPKLGATWRLTPQQHLFASWRHGFRVPAEGQLFRQGSAADTLALEPVKADQVEIGWRAADERGRRVELALYHLRKRNDILTFRNPVTGLNEVLNAGETLHRGIELGVHLPWDGGLSLEAGWSYAKHTYEEWVARSGSVNVDYSGKEMEAAPRTLGSTRLRYGPPAWRGGHVTLEWIRLGPYWEDADNTHRYEGHDLINLMASYPLGKALDIFVRVFNLFDTRFAENASFTVTRGEELAPGLPRTFYAGIRQSWRP